MAEYNFYKREDKLTLDSRQKNLLKAKAHHLKPVVRIGQHGLGAGIIGAAEACLERHELIKVHVHEGKREERQAMIDELVERTNAQLVHRIGKVFILYRERQEER